MLEYFDNLYKVMLNINYEVYIKKKDRIGLEVSSSRALPTTVFLIVVL